MELKPTRKVSIKAGEVEELRDAPLCFVPSFFLCTLEYPVYERFGAKSLRNTLCIVVNDARYL